MKQQKFTFWRRASFRDVACYGYRGCGSWRCVSCLRVCWTCCGSCGVGACCARLRRRRHAAPPPSSPLDGACAAEDCAAVPVHQRLRAAERAPYCYCHRCHPRCRFVAAPRRRATPCPSSPPAAGTRIARQIPGPRITSVWPFARLRPKKRGLKHLRARVAKGWIVKARPEP